MRASDDVFINTYMYLFFKTGSKNEERTNTLTALKYIEKYLVICVPNNFTIDFHVVPHVYKQRTNTVV